MKTAHIFSVLKIPVCYIVTSAGLKIFKNNTLLNDEDLDPHGALWAICVLTAFQPEVTSIFSYGYNILKSKLITQHAPQEEIVIHHEEPSIVNNNAKATYIEGLDPICNNESDVTSCLIEV